MQIIKLSPNSSTVSVIIIIPTNSKSGKEQLWTNRKRFPLEYALFLLIVLIV